MRRRKGLRNGQEAGAAREGCGAVQADGGVAAGWRGAGTARRGPAGHLLPCPPAPCSSALLHLKPRPPWARAPPLSLLPAQVPVVRMYGVTEGGSSVAAFVHGFEPYFYVEAPSPAFSPDDCQALAGELNVSGARRGVGYCAEGRDCCARQLCCCLPAVLAAPGCWGAARSHPPSQWLCPAPAVAVGAGAQGQEEPAPGAAPGSS